jgi:hypothetical protein
MISPSTDVQFSVSHIGTWPSHGLHDMCMQTNCAPQHGRQMACQQVTDFNTVSVALGCTRYVKNGWMDGWTGGRTDGRTDGWTDGWMDGRTDG